jgi:D-alanyl-D-alanine carboxypeptidase/D-alanyl-D-alanine-endopeptidase (penicillin-binding protein 4)
MGYTYVQMRIGATIVTVAAALALAVPGAPAALGQGGGGGGAGLSGSATTTSPTTTSPTTTSPTTTSPATTVPAAARAMVSGLNAGMRQAGSYSGAEVVDLSTGQTVYAHNATVGRLPASVEKLYTTTTALARFGATATLSTTVLGQGVESDGTFTGTLYLRGGGDPTFGSSSFDQSNYGTGATMQQLVANLIAATQIRTLNGNIVADESVFDSIRGTPATGDEPSIEVEGELSGLAYDRGWANSDGTAYVMHPALSAGQQFAAALTAAGVTIGRHATVTAGVTPPSARALASVASPPIATLIALTNTPSDNFFAETLLKDIGAHFGTGGTTAAGAAVVSAEMATSFGINPRLDDGSGLSRDDLTTPAQVVTLLRQMAANPTFTNSLAIAGETGTLQDEMRGTIAQGRCRGKTGTLSDVSNVVGYCRAQDGHVLAYAFMMNGIDPDYAHPIQDRMQVALARYDG